MAILKNQLVRCALIALFVGLLHVGCGGKKSHAEELGRRVKGTVTYQRIPITVNDEGYPVGLGSPVDVETLPLRGAFVRAVYSAEETMPDDSKVKVWRQSEYVYTDNEGYYTLALPDDDTLPVFVEIQSVFGYSGSSYMRIIADPEGMYSKVPQADRMIYSMRRGLDGTTPTSDNKMMPAAAQEGNVQLDFEISIEDEWLIGHPARGNSLNNEHAQNAKPESELGRRGTGSKIAAIIDTAYKAAIYFGSPAPDGMLDLHYCQGITEHFGTYVEYDRENFPLAFDAGTSTGGGSLHYFGSVRGGPNPETDDAWDEGALLAMMARNSFRVYGVPNRFHFPPKKGATINDAVNRQTAINLHPAMAMAEGLPEAMAAITLKTPYLTSGSGVQVRDIRDVAGLPKDIFSGPTIAALFWEIALKANEIESPGDPSTWTNINPASIARLYLLQYIYDVDGETGEVKDVLDFPSLFTQLGRLYEAYDLGNGVTLADIFTEDVISELTEPFFDEKIWPRPQEGKFPEYFIKDWGTDPGYPSLENGSDSGKPIPSFTLSMADSVLDAAGNYSNITKKEIFTSRIQLSKDTPYLVSVATEPPLPNGASIELRVNGNALSPYFFNSASPEPKRIVLTGSGDYLATYSFDFCIKSPKVKVSGDIQVQVRLDPSH